jgi:hypothetical protein
VALGPGPLAVAVTGALATGVAGDTAGAVVGATGALAAAGPVAEPTRTWDAAVAGTLGLAGRATVLRITVVFLVTGTWLPSGALAVVFLVRGAGLTTAALAVVFFRLVPETGVALAVAFLVVVFLVMIGFSSAIVVQTPAKAIFIPDHKAMVRFSPTCPVEAENRSASGMSVSSHLNVMSGPSTSK